MQLLTTIPLQVPFLDEARHLLVLGNGITLSLAGKAR
jgi:hypothetical protein